MRVVAIVNQKGGVGKTTTAVTLAHALALKGKTVWVIDMDPQGHVAVVLGIPPERGLYDLLIEEKPARDVLRDTGRPGLSIIPGDKWTTRAQRILDAESMSLGRLARALRPARGQAGPDYVIIDTPPTAGLLQGLALWAANLVVIPCACDFLSTDGVTKAMESLAYLAGEGWTGTLVGVVPTFYDDTTRESRAVREDLIKTLGPDRVLPPVHRATVLKECAASGRTIWEVEPTSRTAREYAALTWAVLRGGNSHGQE